MNTFEKLRITRLISVLTVTIGLMLMVAKIYADSEPGAIPILLIVFGTGWYFIMRIRTHSSSVMLEKAIKRKIVSK